MNKINKWENKVIEDGLILIKIYLSISKENQEKRFHLRETSALKYWKISPNDWKAQKRWQILTTFKEVMFNKTSTRESPWVSINSDNKMIGRLNAMRYVLSFIEYDGKENLKQKKWTRDAPQYELMVNNVLFDNLNKEQYDILYKIKANEQ